MSFFRILWQSWQQLVRQAWIWAATLVVFVLAFASVDGLMGANILADQLLNEARQRVDISVAFKADTPPALVEQAKTYLISLPGVADVRVTSADQALEAFRQRYQYQEEVLAALTEVGKNPLGAKLVVRAKTLNDYAQITRAIQAPTYTPWIQGQSAADHAAAVSELELLRRAVRLTGSLLLILFSCAGLLLAFNAVRLAIFAQREEIMVMRLVGATRLRIRGPYLLSVLSVVVLGWGLVLAGGAAAFFWLLPQVSGWVRAGLFSMQAAFIQQRDLLLIQLGVAAVLSLLVAWIATGKYIKR